MKTMSAKEIQEKLSNGEHLNIIDVRETYEVAAGKIPTAVNIPLGIIDSKITELDKSKEYIIVCLSGGRSSSAAGFLESQGFNVTNMAGGMMAWTGEVE